MHEEQRKLAREHHPTINLDSSGNVLVPVHAPRVETRSFDSIVEAFSPTPPGGKRIFMQRLAVGTITPQAPVDQTQKIFLEAYRPTVYRTPGNFVLFGIGPTPNELSDRYR